ncbi:MAG: PAS domain-containing protein [Holophagaceae bacterium]|nr:PAS domain-containing protein [Holophagaceae bacterium]
MLQDLFLALLLPLPPWLGFWIFRRKGRVGLSYGYFLGGILAVLSLPWLTVSRIAGIEPLPSAFLGGTLFGFSLFVQLNREGAQGIRRLGFGVGGATIFAWLLSLQVGLDAMESFLLFWGTTIAQTALWMLLSDLGYRLSRGRWLSARVPVVGGITVLICKALYHFIPGNITTLSFPASLLVGMLLGLVALQQLTWLRAQGIWVEGRGDAVRTALTALDVGEKPEGPSLLYGIESEQPMLLVNDSGAIAESNGAFSHLVGLPRHEVRGLPLSAMLQGQDASTWDDLRQQLIQRGRGRTASALVHKDGAFQDVQLEAVPFDRNMALMWISDQRGGTLALRGESAGPALMGGEVAGATQRSLANALGTIVPAAEQILGETLEHGTREAAELILLAAQRISPGGQGNAPGASLAAALDAAKALDGLIPKLQRMLPPLIQIQIRAEALPLGVSEDALQRVATHLVLHGRKAMGAGTMTLVVELQELGGRRWALLTMDLAGSHLKHPQAMLGLPWLQQVVGEFRGMLELTQDDHGGIWPQIYLPLAEPEAAATPSPLLSRYIWIVDQDPLVREALENLVIRKGGQAMAFPGLGDLLRASKNQDPPDALVLERSPTLERFAKAMSGFQREPIPTLVMGNGQAQPVSPLRLGLIKLGFIEKPFPSQEFVQSLLALLRKTNGQERA